MSLSVQKFKSTAITTARVVSLTFKHRFLHFKCHFCILHLHFWMQFFEVLATSVAPNAMLTLELSHESYYSQTTTNNYPNNYNNRLLRKQLYVAVVVRSCSQMSGGKVISLELLDPHTVFSVLGFVFSLRLMSEKWNSLSLNQLTPKIKASRKC